MMVVAVVVVLSRRRLRLGDLDPASPLPRPCGEVTGDSRDHEKRAGHVWQFYARIMSAKISVSWVYASTGGDLERPRRHNYAQES